MMLKQFSFEIFVSFVLFLLELCCKLGFSVLIQLLFDRVSELGEGNNKQIAYIYAVCSGVVLILSQISRNNGMYESRILSSRLKAQMIFMIYTKISKISMFSVKSQEMGKIMNLLSNDFNIIESKVPMIFSSLVSPIAFIGVIIILTFRFGWPGVIIICVVLVIIPLQVLVSKINGNIISKINKNKDSRIKVSTQIIEGIKFIKLYGWETVFENIVQKIRNN